jgi:hypothetical protein
MKVAVYYNLHKHTFSLQSRNKEDYGRVIEHAEHVILKNANYVVRTSGRNKVLQEKKKNVHAYVVGEVVEGITGPRYQEKTVTYNPYKAKSFYIKETGEPIASSGFAVLRKDVNGKPTIGAY